MAKKSKVNVKGKERVRKALGNKQSKLVKCIAILSKKVGNARTPKIQKNIQKKLDVLTARKAKIDKAISSL